MATIPFKQFGQVLLVPMVLGVGLSALNKDLSLRVVGVIFLFYNTLLLAFHLGRTY